MPIDSVPVQPLVALVAGILILIDPRLLNINVEHYLLVTGLARLVARLRRQGSQQRHHGRP